MYDDFFQHHACCKEELKFGNPKEDVFLAKSGFGGAEYLLPGMVTEGLKRGLTRAEIAKLTSFTPAQRYGLKKKGSLAVDPCHDLHVELPPGMELGQPGTVDRAEIARIEGGTTS
jgi:allantoinase